MNATASLTRSDCETCLERMVCHCLEVTEEMLLQALAIYDIQSVKDIRQHTGAGDGCTACHRRLRNYLDQRVALPMAQASSS